MIDRPRPHLPSECRRHHDLVVDFSGTRPEIVCLCGSTRFRDDYTWAARWHTQAGRIVLTCHEFERNLTDAERAAHDELYRRQIELADEVYVINPGGYVGESTRSEIDYARKLGKPVRYLVDETGSTP